ncbi:hypothetical protein [Bryobacter aggregatus]|uniref:hypothetical protein n=1 Tax=Bryobacter aggregatus TaxID=360054 RepID=UPI0004E10B58|nr:hypothetical protein [Bryobacter aggregatus]
MNFLLAKKRTLHIFHENGKSVPFALQERDSALVGFATPEAIPVGVYIECLDQQAQPVEQTHLKPLLTISVELKDEAAPSKE